MACSGQSRDQGSRGAHRRPGARLSPRHGFEGIAFARGRDRDRQAHRGPPRGGELATANRIEPGGEAMMAGFCESPLTFQAVIIWRDELNEGKVLLRDIIDVDATYAGPGAKAVPAPAINPDGQLNVGFAVPDQPGSAPRMQA